MGNNEQRPVQDLYLQQVSVLAHTQRMHRQRLQDSGIIIRALDFIGTESGQMVRRTLERPPVGIIVQCGVYRTASTRNIAEAPADPNGDAAFGICFRAISRNKQTSRHSVPVGYHIGIEEYPVKPFDHYDFTTVYGMVAGLQLEQTSGILPDLNPDLTEIIDRNSTDLDRPHGGKKLG